MQCITETQREIFAINSAYVLKPCEYVAAGHIRFFLLFFRFVLFPDDNFDWQIASFHIHREMKKAIRKTYKTRMSHDNEYTLRFKVVQCTLKFQEPFYISSFFILFYLLYKRNKESRYFVVIVYYSYKLCGKLLHIERKCSITDYWQGKNKIK